MFQVQKVELQAFCSELQARNLVFQAQKAELQAFCSELQVQNPVFRLRNPKLQAFYLKGVEKGAVHLFRPFLIAD